MEECAKKWQVKPLDPGWWSGAAAFPASPHCARKGRDTPRANGTHKADEVCAAPRAVSFPKCNLTVVIAHKAASSMILAQFENICQEMAFASSRGAEHTFRVDHSQDVTAPRRRQRRRLQRHGGGASGLATATAQPLLAPLSLPLPLRPREYFTVSIVRDPFERATGMFNMVTNCAESGLGAYLTADDVATVQRDWLKPRADQIQWRFGKFLDWLATKPPLTGVQVHFTPQARYLGVGCRPRPAAASSSPSGSSGSTSASAGPAQPPPPPLAHVDLVGRSERLPALVAHLAAALPPFSAQLANFTRRGGAVAPWYSRFHDARGNWAMDPCLLTPNHAQQIRRVFADDFACFGSGVLGDTNAPAVLQGKGKGKLAG